MPEPFPPVVTERWRRAALGRETLIQQAGQRMEDLTTLMADLRGPGGCPWDREQSLASLRQYVLEEAQEVVAAVDRILEFEALLRQNHNLAPCNPAAPDDSDTARTAQKGHSIAHHPHHPDFDPAASASGAPLPAMTGEEATTWRRLLNDLRSELGDLLLQSVFMGDILHGMGVAGVEDSLSAIVEKLIRRHPHIYGDTEAQDSATVLANWERIKAEEAREP